MPAKNTIRKFAYHIYNRGVGKRTIFVDKQDYEIFLHFLKYHLSPKNEGTGHPLVEESSNINPVKPHPLINLCREIELIAYCLMPNHFHLLLKQITKDGITKLTRALTTIYAMYFNRKYNRVETLFQGKYKTALVTKDNYLLHLSRYIHLNPLCTGSDPVLWPYSSYPYFLELKKADWVKPEIVIKFFERPDSSPVAAIAKFQTYKDFVEAGIENPKEGIEKLILEDE